MAKPTPIYNRLGLNFDTEKFGEANVLGEKTLNFLKVSRTNLETWQYNDIANNTSSRVDYFQNPMSANCANIKTSINSIVTFSTSDDYANSWPNASYEAEQLNLISNNLLIAIDQYKTHTDNISGLNIYMTSADIPCYDMIMSIGTEILRLTVSQEDLANASPMLGSMTSLFVGPELANSVIELYTDEATINANTTLVIDPETMTGNLVCNLTANIVNVIITHVTTAYNLVEGRRSHDWTFYQNSKNVLDDLMMVDRFSRIGNTQSYIINNYIGTEKLKTSIANT